MVGKTYLRYIVGPQGGAVASNASLALCSVVAPFSYADASARPGSHGGNGGGGRNGQRTAVAGAVVFVASLEAVRVYSVRSGALQHTLIPAEAKMPLEVTVIRVLPLESSTTGRSHLERDGWILLVGYHNGHVAVFSCGPTNNYGLPLCRFYALGHKVDTAVLALAIGSRRAYMCSGGQDTDLTVWDLMTQEASFRLRGHRGGVVGIEFVPRKEEDRLVVTGAADGLVKVWDIALRQCVQTLVASDAQVSSLRMDSAGRRLYCGLRESQLKVFNTEALLAEDASRGEDAMAEVVEHGSIQRKLQKPVTSMSFSHDGAFLLACTSKTVEVFRVLTREEVRRKISRKRKRRAARNDGAEGGEEDDYEAVEPAEGEEVAGQHDGGKHAARGLAAGANAAPATASASEEVVLLRTFFLDQKVRSACFIPHAGSSGGGGMRDADRLHIAVTFNNNNVCTYTTALATTELAGAATWTLEDLKPRHTMEQQGHQSDIRQLTFVEDDTTLLSLGAEKVMMWNVSLKPQYDDVAAEGVHDFYDAKEANVHHADATGTLTCTGHVAVDAAVTMAAISASLCCVGLQDGSILLVDPLASNVIFTEPEVHVGGVRHVVRRPDSSGFMSVGADRRLIVWTLALLKDAGDATRKKKQVNNDNKVNSNAAPQLLQSMEIELTEAPLFLSLSPDNRFVAVGLQNTNIQLFFADTMKPYLSLFGHKLPPTAVAFSSDGTLVASVGMDKSLRLWGTDFGDCHRAIHAHDDYVTQVEFLQDTHQLLTVSLDGSVKHWDGDNWTMIQMFRQHQRGVWTVAATANGTCLATAGMDKCIRCFLRTQDIVFPAEEEERMAQEAMDEEAARRVAMQTLEQQNPEVAVAGQLTTATAAAAEKLMEALDLVSVELQRRENAEDLTPPHPLLANKTVWEYLWSIIESVRPSEVRHALSALTSTHVDALLTYLEAMLRERAVLNYEIAAKIVLALVAAPPGLAALGNTSRAAIAGEISEAHGARRLAALRRMIAEGLDRAVGRMDYNIAGLQFLRHTIEEKEKTRFFDLSKIQGHKKKYHSRALAGDSGRKNKE
ncbi:U3 small nucleolar RNA-associated protein 12 [Trypanosoma rangeli]|uniref:U3 small nucleolar RNA-associated protein 12 n=1 Tax=Trypanosoma rangeli TaxID=5698 RepID=A0A3S5IRJ3_TRYRA|nr:U3 small nucleolar RNA-associated protein 12 [Trypanosoma rangeli]RNF07084.1 U3 small nucleolar RNA-associated protein 12 [Trypanosoma rangeli]|eukprot:RNF07084.1 U3 small nucleolar RNA-associated protein 12 [Trypanosoma rangeli]